ncbi:hypothetical protein HYH02_006753 [Chlamydomonas schloesseri]|uniref:UBX domain-containing protein n=1 Tax=Chlamydomonas schloesseri TaxID=2026947 RepID=A0A835WIF7_9CHLO|nr:hypothetical protein HYH02_006753 [Chlamydomonas schloesseri]|eukprot:KAG2448168.1 hypothetical protein HYH02_006753 [Chlamydomonas schloesseri]
MADDGGDLIANFLAITGADEGVAIQCLEAANFNLEEAVNLFFAADGHFGGGGGAGGARGGAAGGAGGGGAGHGGAMDEDEVRAPLPTKVERLYGDDSHFDPRAMAAALQARHQGLAGRPAAAPIDVFRDIRAETAAAAAAAAVGGAAAPGAAGAAAAAPAPAPQGLSGLFKLPEDLVYAGNAQMARAQAQAEGRWLLVNVQSATEFASHRLNRDTWSHEALKEILKGTFVFYQTFENSSDGKALVKAYRLDALAPPGGPVCPATLVVDPVTGAQLWHRAGFIDAEKLMEELVPFMDHGPLDAGAASIAQSNMKRKVASSNAVAAAAGAGGAAAGGGGGRQPMTEDEELAMAIAMSMERGGGDGAGPSGGDAAGGARGGDGGHGDDDDDDDDMDEAAIWAQIQAKEAAEAEAAAAAEAASKRKSPEEVAAEALARVPEEPAEGDPQALRVALRLPDGSRVMRRFRKSEAVRCLYDLALAKVQEAAAGRSVTISHATPGGAALTDQDQSLEAAGVAGAMLAVKLMD